MDSSIPGPAGSELFSQNLSHTIVYYNIANTVYSIIDYSKKNTEIVDECTTESHNCQHNCHNTLESYYCSCQSGYDLNSDGTTCRGEFQDKNE